MLMMTMVMIVTVVVFIRLNLLMPLFSKNLFTLEWTMVWDSSVTTAGCCARLPIKTAEVTAMKEAGNALGFGFKGLASRWVWISSCRFRRVVLNNNGNKKKPIV